jgi:hypothetical protein
VLSSILRGEHASRYRQSPHIRVLEWDYESIRYFLDQKVGRLDRSLLLSPRQSGMTRWLGTDRIFNSARDVTEDATDYLLRHTRMIPRDVVVLGNAICEHTGQPRAHEQGRLTDDVLRRVVGQVARGLADEQIRICANQIAADQIPARGGHHGLTDYFIGSHEYSDGTASRLMALLAEVGRDRFDHDTVKRLAERGHEELDGYEHLVDVLWHNGVLGYDSPEEGADYAHFYTTTEADDFHLPADKVSYVLHPCIGHLVRMQHVGPVPVRGFRKD